MEKRKQRAKEGKERSDKEKRSGSGSKVKEPKRMNPGRITAVIC